MNNQKMEGGEPEKAILLQLILSPIPKRSNIQKLFSFLSHDSWQGISGIISLLSLITSVVLTVYVFQITQEQQVANFETEPIVPVAKYTDAIEYSYLIHNKGPATGQDINILLKGQRNIIDCRAFLLLDETSEIRPKATSEWLMSRTPVGLPEVQGDFCRIILNLLNQGQFVIVTVKVEAEFKENTSQMEEIFYLAMKPAIHGLNVQYISPREYYLQAADGWLMVR